jgi:hypothetical protein
MNALGTRRPVIFANVRFAPIVLKNSSVEADGIR